MSRIEMAITVQSALPPTELVKRVLQLSQQRGIKFTQVAENQIDVRRGSQAALRIKGGIFSKSSDFPVVTVLRCDPSDNGTNAVINALDDLGFGLKLGMEKKYQTAVREFGEIIANLIAEASAN